MPIISKQQNPDGSGDKPSIVIVTPARPAANNGNWQTTARWAQFLAADYDVTVVNEWNAEPAELLIALHARRSAPSIAEFARQGKPVVVVLTGTDLYRDIRSDHSAQHSLAVADRLVVLQERGLNELSADQQARTSVIEQSASTLPKLAATGGTFDLILAGHMRAEKDPLTALRAFASLSDPNLRLRHVGRMDDPQIENVVLKIARNDVRIELLGSMDHEQTRDVIRHGALLLLPSLMEGGANVLIESVTSGVPVLASRIPGSIGMLGPDYEGYFPVGDAPALAALIDRAQHDPEWLAGLTVQCQARAHLFTPQREARLVNQLVSELLAPPEPGQTLNSPVGG